ncbi:MAG TPA: alpha/beta hydrolase fold domain-containing protein [Blastocatellia bacterium]|nr:alpha/beta hydrolase fold domain-containing protein [Blastocatellia bacterium]
MNTLMRIGCLTATVLLGVQAPIVSTRETGRAEPVLLFGIGMHIEPLGRTAQGYGSGGADYRQGSLFERHVQDILTVARMIEAHGGRMTVQAQSPFTQVATERGNTILADLEARGHEIGLHFHEDAHLGRNPEQLAVETWCAVMQQEIGLIHQAGVKNRIRYWSGGNLYPGLLGAASCAGLEVNSDWKNPRTQRTDPSLLGVNPWRPTGGPSENDLSAFATHNPNGKIVFLPEGMYDPEEFARKREIIAQGGDQAWFEVLREALESSLASARADRVNVFHFTVHPGEFRGDSNRPFGAIEDFLTRVVDPLVEQGRVRWATFSQMTDEFIEWEETHPGVDPRSSSAAMAATVSTTTNIRATPRAVQKQASPSPAGYITFAINVHDWRNIDESANTLLRLISIFEKYGVRGDFYLTEPMVYAYAERRPEVITRLKESGMTISYHVRPPHALYVGFDQALRGLSGQALTEALREYETYRLDLATGGLLRDQPGGYSFVAQTFGRPPVVVGAPNNNPTIKTAALRVYKELGAQMAVIYHECCADPDQPFEYRDGLLVRPSDFSITRWSVSGGPQEAFWWNMLQSRYAAEYNPTNYLKKKLSEWSGSRPPFITALIHENNFSRQGPESWTLVYYADRERTRPLIPPFDLNAPDLSRPRSPEEQEAIWAAYEQLVAYAAANLRVVTSEDIVAMADESMVNENTSNEQALSAPAPANNAATASSSQTQAGRVDRDVTYCTVGDVALKMDIYYPAASRGPAPVAVYVHGGGWTTGDKARGEGVRDIPELVARGYLVAAVNYRLAPRYKFPAMIQDVKCAVRFLRANARRYNINPDRIGAWGGSAGGHLVALLGTADETAGWDVGQYLDYSSRIQAVVDMFGPTDLTAIFDGANPRLLEQVFGTTDRTSEAVRRASPVTWVSRDDPPFLILHGERDPLVPPSQSQIFYDKLVQTGVPATLVMVKNAGHGFVPMGGPISPTRDELTRMIADFFDRYLKKMPASNDRYGVSQGAHRDSVLMPRSFELAAQAGIGWVRFGIWYSLVNPSPGVFRYEESGFDAQVAGVRQRGLQILGQLGFAAPWNTTAPSGLPPGADPLHFPPRDLRAWADYVSQTVSRYKDEIQYWEVWNEPDLRGFWAGTAAQYAELLAVTYDAIKRANPDAKVVLGGLALGGPPQQLNRNFLTEILNDARYPAARYFDIMNFHHYGSREEARQRMDDVRAALRQAGASNKPIWITETGYSSDPSQQNDPNYRGLEGQAEWLRDMIPYLLELGAEKVFWYRLYDYPADFNQDVGARYHGLIDNQGNPKPAYFAYKELIQATTSVTDSTESPPGERPGVHNVEGLLSGEDFRLQAGRLSNKGKRRWKK